MAFDLIASTLDGRSSTLRLLACMIRRYDWGPTRLIDIARDAAVPTSTAMRDVNKLVAIGLVRESERTGRTRLIRIDVDHELFGTVAEIAYLFMGATLPPKRGTAAALHSADWGGWDRLRFEHVPGERLVPDMNEVLAGHGGPNSAYVARVSAREIDELYAELRRPWGYLQQSYRQWSNERDRDFIHQFGALGANAYRASLALKEAANGGGPDGTGSVYWLYAAAALAIEARYLGSLARWFEMSATIYEDRVDADRELERAHQLQARVDSPEKAARHGEALTTKIREDALADRERAEARIVAVRDSANGLYRVGGTPVFEDVGAAGERYLWGWARDMLRAALGLHTSLLERCDPDAIADDSPIAIEFRIMDVPADAIA